LAKALSLSEAEREVNTSKVSSLKKRFISSVLKEIPCARINTPANSVSNIVHVTFLSENKTDIIKNLDNMGICVSSGSACASNKNKHSTVLSAMGFSEKEMGTSVRFSFGKYNSKSDIKYIIKSLKKYFKNAF
jgi:cysteine desulfurase